MREPGSGACPPITPPADSDDASLVPRVDRLTQAAERARGRSESLIAECRALLSAHSAAVAGLRLSLAAGADGRTAAALSGADGLGRLVGEVEVGPLALVPLRRTIIGPTGTVRLTPAEWQLLVALAMSRPSILTRSRLAVAAWGAGFAGRHGEVEVYVSRLRRKLARCGAGVAIQTVRGQGYRLAVDGEEDAATPAGDGGVA